MGDPGRRWSTSVLVDRRRFLLLAAVPRAVLAAEKGGRNTGPDAKWANVSANFTKQIGADDMNPAYLCRCQGLIVTPTGHLVLQTAAKGICVSRDRGATWSVVEDNNIKGRCETGFGFSLAYPYDGRMALFCYDGGGRLSGGISLNGAGAGMLSQIVRGVEFADVDWNAPDPQTIFGMTHEPFFTVLSVDRGKSWQKLYQGTRPANVTYTKSSDWASSTARPSRAITPDKAAWSLDGRRQGLDSGGGLQGQRTASGALRQEHVLDHHQRRDRHHRWQELDTDRSGSRRCLLRSVLRRQRAGVRGCNVQRF